MAKPAPKKSAVSPARAAAFDILLRIEKGQGHSDELLREPVVNRLFSVDRNLCTALVMGVLRWQLLLDKTIAAFLKKPNAKLDNEIRIALRLGAYQLLYMSRIPVHAAISESVELAKKAGHRFASGMVNAVLRQVSKIEETQEDLSSANVTSHPQWMVERWSAAYGTEAANAICAFDQEQPVLSVRLLHAEAESRLLAEGIDLSAGVFLHAARRVVRGDVTATETFRRGWVRLQDEASQLIAELAGQGKTILDCCAAPGGKTAVLAELNPEAEITACDVSPRRLAQMRTALSAYPFASEINCREMDAATLKADESFDVVLCDVPCSGTGTLARNPEIKYRLNPEDFLRQQSRQKEILKAAMQAVRPGGRLVYSTCSLEPEENEQVVEKVLQEGWSLLPMEQRLHALAKEGRLSEEGQSYFQNRPFPSGYLRTLPGVDPCDGFFAAILQRNAR